MTKANIGRILLAEDEEHLAFALKLNLEAEGYEVIHVNSGDQALMRLNSDGHFDLLVLDVMMPGVNGIQVAKIARHKDPLLPIILLTALGAEQDRLAGLESGADDYLTKPFVLAELLLRIRRALHRAQLFGKHEEKKDKTPKPSDRLLQAGVFHLDVDRLILSAPHGEHQITALEADVLYEFFKHPGQVLSREYLLEKVWGVSAEAVTRTVDNFVVRLRRYIEEDPKNPRFLLSIRSRGYQFKPD